MFLNSLFCLWGSESKEVSPPSSYVDRDRGSASSSGVSGLEGVMPSRQSLGGLSHEVSATAPLVLSPYYYQHVELLRQLGELYQQNPNDPDICGALAQALEKLSYAEGEEKRSFVISDLKRKAAILLEDGEQAVEYAEDYNQNYRKVEEFISKYTFAQYNKGKEESFEGDEDILAKAPITYWYIKASYLRAIGKDVKASEAFIKYGELNAVLDSWVKRFVESYYSDQ